jgi:hypothetical protein
VEDDQEDMKETDLMIKGSPQQDGMMVVNIYAPKVREPDFIKKHLRSKGEILSNTVGAGDHSRTD